ncbi:MAG: TIGR03032 family protein [Parvularculaceae bacterium]
MASDAARTVQEKFVLTTSRLFSGWLADQNASLVFSTYQAGKLFLIGVNKDGNLSVFERTIERPMALCAHGRDLYLSSLFQLWKFCDITRGADYEGYDRLYAPRVGWVTGDLDIHDIKADRSGRIIFVNTLFSCLATLSDEASFAPIWKPNFISKLAAEDRCHLNGLAMRDGRPAFVSAVAQTDIADGWRDRRRDGGVIIDVESGEVVASGLSMPHSPRWRDGKVWILNAGSGELGFVDPDTGSFTAVAFCPGFLRGLHFLGDFAIATMSLPRGNRTFEGLPLEQKLAAAGADPRCGVAVIDLRSGDLVHWLRIEGVVTELFDAVLLQGVKRPAAIGFRSDEVRRVLSIAPDGAL